LLECNLLLFNLLFLFFFLSSFKIIKIKRCARAGIPGAVVCATMLDRLQGDQVTLPGAILNSLTKRASSIVIDYIATKLALQH